jgi:hypothetical protein
MTMTEDGPLFLAFRTLRADWPSRSWSWDDRLAMVTSAFGKEHLAQTQAIVVAALPRQFGPETIAEAPKQLLAVVEDSGGLRGNQLAFCGEDLDCMGYGLWWPWGGGGMVSLRIGVVGADTDALTTRLRALFEVG